MKSRLLFVSAVLFLPIATTLTQFGVRNYLAVMVLALVPLAIAAGLMDKKNVDLQQRSSPLRTVSTLFIALVALQVVLFLSNVREAVYWSVGYALSIALISYLSRYEREEVTLFLERMFRVIGVVFLLQLFGSAYESYQGSLLAGGRLFDEQMEPDVGLEGTDFENRIIFRLFTSELGWISEFKLPFSGLIGQHNYWGTQLPFYNLVFLYQYHNQRKRRWLVLSGLCLVAAIFNTTRFGIAAIVISDLLVFLHETKGRWKVVKTMLVFSGLFIVWNVGQIAGKAHDYYSLTNTLTFRLEVYEKTLDYYESQDIMRVVFGSGTKNIVNIARKGIGSFESEFFHKLIFNGLVGLILFLVLLFRMAGQSGRMEGYCRFMGYLITLNVVMVSLISNLVFVYSVIGVVTLLYVYNVEQSVIRRTS